MEIQPDLSLIIPMEERGEERDVHRYDRFVNFISEVVVPPSYRGPEFKLNREALSRGELRIDVYIGKSKTKEDLMNFSNAVSNLIKAVYVDK